MEERTVPLTAAALCLGDEDLVKACAVRLGERVEVSIPAVAERGGEAAASRLTRYWDAARRLWATGEGQAVIVRRTLVQAAQRDVKDGRVELSAELAALEMIPEGSELVESLLGPRMQFVGPCEENGNETTVVVSKRMPEWPTALGGPAGPNEVQRHVKIVANHAKWRDRKVRRLVRVEVSCDELWPDPEHHR